MPKASTNDSQVPSVLPIAYTIAIIVHGQIEFERRSTRALRENEPVKKYYLGG